MDKNGSNSPWKKPIIPVGLGLALIFSLLPKYHQKAKYDIAKIITLIWLIYSIYYKDYAVMVICIIILLYYVGLK